MFNKQAPWAKGKQIYINQICGIYLQKCLKTYLKKIKKIFKKVWKNSWHTLFVVIKWVGCHLRGAVVKRMFDLMQIKNWIKRNDKINRLKFVLISVNFDWVYILNVPKTVSKKITKFVRAVEFLELGFIVLNSRVWFWLRMNAGGVLNTCKSNGCRTSVLH